jgi:hypothetical protein
LNDPFEGILPIQKISEISDEDIVKMKLQIEKLLILTYQKKA